MTKTVRGKIGIGVIAVTAAAVAVMSAACDSNKRRTETKTETAQAEDVANVETSSAQCNADDIHGVWKFKELIRGEDGERPRELTDEEAGTTPQLTVLHDNSALLSTYGSMLGAAHREDECGNDYILVFTGLYAEGGYEAWDPPKQEYFRYDPNTKLLAWVSGNASGWAHYLLERDANADIELATEQLDMVDRERIRAEFAEAARRSREGTFTDPRDNQTYRIVRIGNRTWFAQNLNYRTANSVCYDNNDDYCTLYGRLYTWEAAKSACPAGWRVPSNDDWTDLMTATGDVYVEEENERGIRGWLKAGTKLKSQHGWNVGEPRHPGIPGTDDLGFTATPGGNAYLAGHGLMFGGITYSGHWWSVTEGCDMGGNLDDWDGKGCPGPTRHCWSVSYIHEFVGDGFCWESQANSVRCVRD